MTISYQFVATTTSLSVSIPTGTAGDVAIVWMEDGDSATAITVPTGYTAVSAMSSGTGGGSGMRVRAAYHLLSGTAGETAAWTKTGGASNSETGGVRISGVHPVTPLASLAAPTFSTSSTVSAPSITVNIGNDHLIVGVNDNNTGTWSATLTSPTYTERTDVHGQCAYTATYTSTTTSGTRNIVESTSSSTFAWSFEVVQFPPNLSRRLPAGQSVRRAANW